VAFVLSGVVISQDCARAIDVERALLLRNGYALVATEERWMMGGDKPPAHILDLAATLSTRSRAVYVEAEFFGGIGAQAALGYDHGAESLGPLRTQSLGGDFVGFAEVPVDQWAINVALEWLGVPDAGSEDRFTAIGLNDFRAATAEEITFAGALPRDGATTLWRPVGRNELALIEATGFRRYPPRLPEQPIFYPVANFEYAEQIARDWNSTDARHANIGFVTRFKVASAVLAAYKPQQVGAKLHTEYWIPADELEQFNDAIIGTIDVVAEYRHGSRVDAG
jgi:hypothetical protein